MKISSKFSIRKIIGLYGGLLIFLLIIIFGDLEPGSPEITYTFAVAILMAIWWITEVIPLAITSLLPIVLFPLFGIMNGKDVSSTYFNHVIFLFIGGFIVALSMQKWNLHKRIALKILIFTGVSPGRILLGFMLATAFLSMWISNTATTMMMIPVLISIINKLEEIIGKKQISKYSIGLLLGVAYSASIGGIATLVGTPPNLSFTRIFQIMFPNAPEISFANWFIFALPVSITFFIIVWCYLYFLYRPAKASWIVSIHPIFIIAIIAFMMTFLTELTSNTATIEMLLPVLAGLSVSTEINPLLFMLPATLSASLAFMLPVATPPNAIIFGTNRLRIIDMAKTGIILNLIGVIIITLATYYLGMYIFNIDVNVFPEWAISR